MTHEKNQPATVLLTCLYSRRWHSGATSSTGAWIDDNILEVAIEREIRASDEAYRRSLVVAVDGLVLLLGQVPSEQLRTQAAVVAGSLQS